MYRTVTLACLRALQEEHPAGQGNRNSESLPPHIIKRKNKEQHNHCDCARAQSDSHLFYKVDHSHYKSFSGPYGMQCKQHTL